MATSNSAPADAVLPLDGLSRWEQIKKFVPLCRETVRQRERAGLFPKRQLLTTHCAVWQNREIHRWLADPLNYRAEGA